MKWVYLFDEYAISYQDIGGTEINEGDAVLMYCRENLITGDYTWHIRKDFAETGYPGNVDGDIRCFHGWRGTTNDIRVEAFGELGSLVQHVAFRAAGRGVPSQ